MSYSYKLKCQNSDFQVNEVHFAPTLLSKKISQYTYVSLTKSGYTTFDTTEKLSDFFELSILDIGAAGLKDEDAITTQTISIKKKIDHKSINSFNKMYNFNPAAYIKIDRIIGYGNEPMVPGILHGNCFKIVVRNLNKKTVNNLAQYFYKNNFFSFINYYDSQRFGMPGCLHNTHLIGEAIVEDDWRKALKEIIKSSNSEAEKLENSRKNIGSSVKDLLLTQVNPNKLSFFVKAYNSFLWNKKLSEEIAVNEGRLVNFQYVGKMFLPANNQFRINNICELDAFSYSIGDSKVFPSMMKRTSCVTTSIKFDNMGTDSLHSGKYSVTLNFFLPTGSYGTMLIRQLFIKINSKK